MRVRLPSWDGRTKLLAAMVMQSAGERISRDAARWRGAAALSTGLEFVACEGRRVGLRTPPALELARVLPSVPQAFRCGVEFGDDRHRQVLRVAAAGDDCHVPAPSSARISAIFVALVIH